jgi:hypothetical protein
LHTARSRRHLFLAGLEVWFCLQQRKSFSPKLLRNVNKERAAPAKILYPSTFHLQTLRSNTQSQSKKPRGREAAEAWFLTPQPVGGAQFGGDLMGGVNDGRVFDSSNSSETLSHLRITRLKNDFSSSFPPLFFVKNHSNKL